MRHSSSQTSRSAASAISSRRWASARRTPRASTSPPFMSTVPEPTRRSSSRRSGRWSSCPITVSTWPSRSTRFVPAPGRRISRSGAWSAEEQGTRSISASSGASAAATAAASSAPCTSPLGDETATSASSSRGARAAMASAFVRIQSLTWSPLSPLALRAGLGDGEHLVGVVRAAQELEVVRRDQRLLGEPLARPADEPRPPLDADEDDGELADLVGLDEHQRLEELVERAEAAGEDDEAGRVADEHELAREEEVEGERDVLVGARRLLERQLDVEADGAGVGLARAAVARLHDARAAAGDDGEACLAERAADVACERVPRVVGRRPRRAEDRDAARDVAERIEAPSKLVVDAREPLGLRVLGGDRTRLRAEQLLVGRRRSMDVSHDRRG